MMRHFRGALALPILLAAAGCTSPDGKSPDSHSTTEKSFTREDSRKACGGLLGEQGSTALGELTGDPQVLAPSGNSGAQAMKKTVARMRSMSAGDATEGKGDLSSICTFRAPSKGVEEQPVSLEYGWSAPPEQRGERHAYYAGGSALIALGFGEHAPESSVYFACRTGNKPPGVVQGRFYGGWYGADLTVREMDERRARILLATASKMSEALGCTNKPDVSPDAKLKKLDANRSPLPGLPDSGAVRE